MYQLHVGMPSHEGALVKKATALETSTPIIPPEKNPMNAMKQPMAAMRIPLGRAAVSWFTSVTRPPGGAPPPRYRRLAGGQSPPAAGHTAAEYRAPSRAAPAHRDARSSF